MQQIIANFKPNTSLEVIDQRIKVLLKNFHPEDQIVVSMHEYDKFIEVNILKDPKGHLRIVK